MQPRQHDLETNNMASQRVTSWPSQRLATALRRRVIARSLIYLGLLCIACLSDVQSEHWPLFVCVLTEFHASPCQCWHRSACLGCLCLATTWSS
ncbi:hypothetical protein BDU57DRAFT_188312 [Ampelomyces quisqualis]|uniref:Uncharacterized protein n=1 Tax=Ampelomyces quisqualis TaxID=50730 RepID=A0A6A5QTF7_AMPQU|nr:hypothetical protein BDU57DRAFT_188312 [Ampelomyces quisqualis]